MEVADIAWSHSALKVYEECPQKYYREKVTKEIPFTQNEAMKRGDDMHKSLENGIGLGVPLPPRWAHLQNLVDWGRSLPGVIVEDQMAFTSKLQLCEWFDRKVKVWGRCKVDLQAHFSPELALVTDWKSGKYWGNDGQDALTALFMFWKYPKLQTVQTCWYYIEQNKKVQGTFVRAQMPDLMDRPLSTLGAISTSSKTNSWPKTPCKSCKFCEVKGCEFRGKFNR